MHLFSVPPHNCQPAAPDDANVFARRAPLPVFGDGLIEAIPDETILALEDPFDRDGNGVRGRAVDRDGRRDRHTAGRPIRLEGATSHAARLRRRCVSERNGDYERSISEGNTPTASATPRCAAAIFVPIRKTSGIR
jgi:CxxC motif-containing protein (DUF1111 family)